MKEPVRTKPPSGAKIRAEREAMVVSDLLGPAGGESEELTERTVRDAIKSAINSAVRQGILSYEGSDTWRKKWRRLSAGFSDSVHLKGNSTQIIENSTQFDGQTPNICESKCRKKEESVIWREQ